MPKLKHPKAKGNRLEKEVVSAFVVAGFPAERCWGSNGESRGLLKEVDVVTEILDQPYHIQCKSVTKLATKYRPPEGIDAVVFKENRGDPYILLPLHAFLYFLGTKDEVPSWDDEAPWEP